MLHPCNTAPAHESDTNTPHPQDVRRRACGPADGSRRQLPLQSVATRLRLLRGSCAASTWPLPRARMGTASNRRHAGGLPHQQPGAALRQRSASPPGTGIPAARPAGRARFRRSGDLRQHRPDGRLLDGLHGMGPGPAFLKKLALDSILRSSLPADRRQRQLDVFQKRWRRFIRGMIEEDSTAPVETALLGLRRSESLWAYRPIGGQSED